MSESKSPNDPAALREELEDRLADLALQEVLGGKRPPDLSQPVLAMSRPPQRSWRTFTKLALAASVLIACGAGAFGWWRSQSARNEIAAADSSLATVQYESSLRTYPGYASNGPVIQNPVARPNAHYWQSYDEVGGVPASPATAGGRD